MSPKRRRAAAVVVAVALVALGTAGCLAPRGATWQNPPSSTGPTSAAPPSASPTPSATQTVSAEDACVTSILSKMTLRQIAGQVMLVGTPIGDPTSVDDVARQYAVGGVFLAGRYKASASSLRAAITTVKAAAPQGVGFLIALDQEGGEVQTLQGPDFPPIPTAQAQGQLSQSTLKSQTEAWAHRLATLGINLDLAPVADTVPASLGTGNPPIGAFHRQYGSDPTKVAAAISTVVKAIQSTGVITTLKHFPGLGRVRENTDFSKDAVDSVETAHDPYLQPFAAGISAGTGAVMMSLASYPKLDSHTIAAFSEPIVTGLLRNQLGFTGLIVSDALGGAAAATIVPLGQRAVRFIQAGGDLALTTQASKAPAMIDGLVGAAQGSASFRTTLTAAATHVLRTKYTAGLLSCSPAQP